jgi:hypothetical protein
MKILNDYIESMTNPAIKKTMDPTKVYDKLKRLNTIGQKKAMKEQPLNTKGAGRKKLTELSPDPEMQTKLSKLIQIMYFNITTVPDWIHYLNPALVIVQSRFLKQVDEVFLENLLQQPDSAGKLIIFSIAPWAQSNFSINIVIFLYFFLIAPWAHSNFIIYFIV